MIPKTDWAIKHQRAWDNTYWNFSRTRQPYYFNDWRGYARCYTDAERGDKRAGHWLAMFTAEMLK